MPSIMTFRIATEQMAEKLPLDLRPIFKSKVHKTLKLLNQETMSLESLAIIAVSLLPE